MSNFRRVAIVNLRKSDLLAAFGLPTDADIQDITICFNRPDLIQVRIAHEELPEATPGEVLRTVNPVFAVDENGERTFQRWWG